MPANTIKNKIEGFGEVDLDTLLETQGNLKVLTEEGEDKLRANIKTNGWDSVFYVWRQKTKAGEKLHVLDGHQRITVLKKLREEGVTLPPLHAVFIEAKTLAQARKIATSYMSQFGDFTVEGIREYLVPLGMADAVQIRGSVIELEREEIDLEGLFEDHDEKHEVKYIVCPECGHEFEK